MGGGGALVHALHLAEHFALVHGQHGGVLPHLLEHGAALKLIAGFLEVVPEEEKGEGSGTGAPSPVCVGVRACVVWL